MPKCFRCGEEIERLVKVLQTEVSFEMTLNKLGQPFYGERINDPENPRDPNYGRYQCPACGEDLYYTEEQAVGFLKGEHPIHSPQEAET